MGKLSNDPIAIPAPLDPYSPTWDCNALIQRLQSVAQPLEKATNDATRELKETQDAQRKRRAALDALYRATLAYNTHFEHLARLVDKHDIADRIRPRGGRPSSSDNVTQDNTSPTTPPNTESPSPSGTPNP